MAKKGSAAVIEKEDTVAPAERLEPVAPAGALAVPSYIPTGNEGREHIRHEDMKIPQLTLAQKGHPQVDDDRAERIDGLKFTEMFNNVTEEVYGNGPLTFSIVRGSKPRFVEFVPFGEGGGVVDPDVRPGDPRTLFTTGANGKRTKPIATEFYDFIIVLWPSREVIALSLKSTQIKVAQLLNTLVTSRVSPTGGGVPIYAGVYEVQSFKDPNESKGIYASFAIRNAGYPSQEDMLYVQGLFNAFKTAKIEIVQSAADGPTVQEQTLKDSEIPFAWLLPILLPMLAGALTFC